MTDTKTTFTNPFITPASPTESITFANARVDGNGITSWTCPGSEADTLASRLILKRMAQKTKAGIVGRTLHLTVPRLNAATGKYDSSIQARITLNAPATAEFSECYQALYYILNLCCEDTAETGFFADFVEANDLPV
jgi:hypothetical protein